MAFEVVEFSTGIVLLLILVLCVGRKGCNEIGPPASLVLFIYVYAAPSVEMADPPAVTIKMLLASGFALAALEQSGGLLYLVYCELKLLGLWPKGLKYTFPLAAFINGLMGDNLQLTNRLMGEVGQLMHNQNRLPGQTVAAAVSAGLLANTCLPLGAPLLFVTDRLSIQGTEQHKYWSLIWPVICGSFLGVLVTAILLDNIRLLWSVGKTQCGRGTASDSSAGISRALHGVETQLDDKTERSIVLDSGSPVSESPMSLNLERKAKSERSGRKMSDRSSAEEVSFSNPAPRDTGNAYAAAAYIAVWTTIFVYQVTVPVGQRASPPMSKYDATLCSMMALTVILCVVGKVSPDRVFTSPVTTGIGINLLVVMGMGWLTATVYKLVLRSVMPPSPSNDLSPWLYMLIVGSGGAFFFSPASAATFATELQRSTSVQEKYLLTSFPLFALFMVWGLTPPMDAAAAAIGREHILMDKPGKYHSFLLPSILSIVFACQFTYVLAGL